jgi:hypothetical protein
LSIAAPIPVQGLHEQGSLISNFTQRAGSERVFVLVWILTEGLL